MATTIERAIGRWKDILLTMGIANRYLTGKHGPCPLCGGKDRYRYTDRLGQGDYFCSQCGAGNGFTLIMKFKGWNFKEAANRVDEIIGKASVSTKMTSSETHLPDRRALRRLWAESAPITQNSPAFVYMASRGIRQIPATLRHIGRMRHASGAVTPGMLALFHGPDGKPSTIHRTWLTEDGRKADVDPVRMFMPGRIAKGGAVRLFSAGTRLGVAEGIETALSAAQIHHMPVWATLTDGLMKAWEPPPEVREVIIFGDNDSKYVGQAAAYELARRLVVVCKLEKVTVEIPKKLGSDWNDVLCSMRGELNGTLAASGTSVDGTQTIRSSRNQTHRSG